MKLLNMFCSPHRGAPERKLAFTRSDGTPHRLVAITGPAGSGKTSLLELIAQHKEHVAPYARPVSRRDVLDDSGARLEIRTEWLLEDAERLETGSAVAELAAFSIWDNDKSQAHADPALVHVLARYRQSPTWGKVDLFPVDRVGAPRVGASGDPLLWQRQRRLALTNDKYAGLSRLVAGAAAGQREDLNHLLAAIRPGLQATVAEANSVVFETPRGVRRLSQLSLSQRLAFQFAATFCLVGLHNSVVLIDTPELGLADGDALPTLNALAEFAPSTQLIVTTTDRGILSSQQSAVISLEDS